MIKNQIRYINKKTLDCRISDRSTNFIAPDFITGCAYKCAYCVEKGTLISTPNGKIPIEDIVEKQEVISYSLDTLQLQKDQVLQVISRPVSKLVELEVDGQKLVLTPEHLVYTVNRGWVEAQYLTLDDEFLCDN